MNRISPLLWLIIIILIVLPSAAGRLLLDLAGGLILISLIIPFLLAGFGWIAWRILQSKMSTCINCGASFMNNLQECPICGSKVSNKVNLNTKEREAIENVPASSVTVDITPEDIDSV